MRTALLAIALVGVVVVPSAGAAPACKNLLVDPAGDAEFLGMGDATKPVEDGQVVDLLSADLGSDRKALTLVIRVKGRNPEGGTGYLDHSWELAFSTATERYIAFAERSRTGGDLFTLYRVVAGGEDDSTASAAEGVATTVTGAVDDVRGIIRMQVAVDAFRVDGGLGRSLTRVRGHAWSGATAYASGGGVGTYGGSDAGSTNTSYVVGAKSCA